MDDFKIMVRLLAAIRASEESPVFNPALVDERVLNATERKRDILAVKLQKAGYIDGLFVIDDADNQAVPCVMWERSKPSANYTKYARDLDAEGDIYNGKKQGYAWCDVFVDWCFYKAFGKATMMSMLYQVYGGAGAGCTCSMRYYKNNGAFYSTPQAGDQIFFTKDGGSTSNHTGIVRKVTSSTVYTVEGNTSSASGVVANGGCVRLKSYSLSYAKIAGYGRPNWSVPADRTVRRILPCEQMYQQRLYRQLGVLDDYFHADWHRLFIGVRKGGRQKQGGEHRRRR